MRINADLVVELRNAKSWSQEELAIASGLNLRTIQRIENEATASLQSKKSLASALEIDVQNLNHEEIKMKPCPVCSSNDVYQYNKEVDSTMISGELLPDLESGMFSSAKIRPVVCSSCGNVRFFADKDALLKLKSSKDWSLV